MWVVFKIGLPFKVVFCLIRVPHFFGGDLKRDPTLENYPYRSLLEARIETLTDLLFRDPKRHPL